MYVCDAVNFFEYFACYKSYIGQMEIVNCRVIEYIPGVRFNSEQSLCVTHRYQNGNLEAIVKKGGKLGRVELPT